MREADYAEFRDAILGADEIADKELARVSKEFQNDPRRLEKEKIVITKWRIKHLERGN